jgi:hypothetical protein
MCVELARTSRWKNWLIIYRKTRAQFLTEAWIVLLLPQGKAVPRPYLISCWMERRVYSSGNIEAGAWIWPLLRLNVLIKFPQLSHFQSEKLEKTQGERVYMYTRMFSSTRSIRIISTVFLFAYNRNWNVFYFIKIFYHNMFRPLRAFLRWNTTSIIFLWCCERHNRSLVLWCSVTPEDCP